MEKQEFVQVNDTTGTSILNITFRFKYGFVKETTKRNTQMIEVLYAKEIQHIGKKRKGFFNRLIHGKYETDFIMVYVTPKTFIIEREFDKISRDKIDKVKEAKKEADLRFKEKIKNGWRFVAPKC